MPLAIMKKALSARISTGSRRSRIARYVVGREQSTPSTEGKPAGAGRRRDHDAVDPAEEAAQVRAKLKRWRGQARPNAAVKRHWRTLKGGSPLADVNIMERSTCLRQVSGVTDRRQCGGTAIAREVIRRISVCFAPTGGPW